LVLLVAIFLGFIAAWIRAYLTKRKLHQPQLKYLWLVFAAYLPQALAFSLPTKHWLPDAWVGIALVGSLVLLLGFVWINRFRPGLWALGIGLILNLAVIALNGGMMPISPDTLKTWSPDVPLNTWEVGKRFGTGKDIVLANKDTRLWFLSDRFVTPPQFSLHIAFSLGDVFIAIGAFLLMWSLANPQPQGNQTGENNNGNRTSTEPSFSKYQPADYRSSH
jgi:hypothetical protein